MVAYKAAQTARFLKQPDPETRAFLLYGPDEGLVNARGADLAKMLLGRAEGEGEVIRLDERDLVQDPDRLAVEARTLSMFAEAKVIRLRGGAALEKQLTGLIDAETQACLIVEAGNLRPTSKLRKLFEGAQAAAALPCYADPARDLAPLIDEELSGVGATIDPQAKAELMALLGSDMGIARSEVAKLALYAGEGGTIASADVNAIVGDSSDIALDALAQAVAEGSASQAVRQFDRLAAAGTGAQAGLAALGRYFARLHRIVSGLEAGGNAKSVLGQLRPPPNFKQRDALVSQAARWTGPKLQRAIDTIQSATAQSRRRPDLERPLAERALLAICQFAK